MPYLVSQGVQGVARDLNQIILPAGYWDLAALGTTTQTGGTTIGAGPLGRGFNDSWQATATGQALTVDLGTVYGLVGVSFGTYYRGDGRYIPSAYAIDYSTDNVTFTNLATVTSNTNAAVTHQSLSSGAPIEFTVRYLRLTVNAFQSGQTYASVAGLQIWSDYDAAGFGNAPWLVDGNGLPLSRALAGVNGHVPLKIGEVVVGSNAPVSVTFASIPQVFRNLRLTCFARDLFTGASSTGTYPCQMTVNGDTGSNYYAQAIDASPTNAVSATSGFTAEANFSRAWMTCEGGGPAGQFATSVITFYNYATANLTPISYIVGAMGTATQGAGPYWNWIGYAIHNVAAAITSITLTGPSVGLAAGSVFSLWGEP